MEDTKTTTFGDFINDILKKDFLAILSLLGGYKKNPNTIPEGKSYEDILAQLTNNKEFIEKWRKFPYNPKNKEIIDKNKTIIKELIKNVLNSTIDPLKIIPISNFIANFILDTIIDEEFYASLRQTNEIIKNIILGNSYIINGGSDYDILKTQIIFGEILTISELNISQLTNEQIQEIIRLLLIKYNYEENKTSDKESMDKNLILTNRKETISQIWKIIIDKKISDIEILNDLIELTPIELITEQQNYKFALGGCLYSGYIAYLIIKLHENVDQNRDNVFNIVKKITNKYYTSEEEKKEFIKKIFTGTLFPSNYVISAEKDEKKTTEFNQEVPCCMNNSYVMANAQDTFKLYQKILGIQESEIQEYNENNIEHVIKLVLAAFDIDHKKKHIEDAGKWNKYTQNIVQFLEKNKEKFGKFSEDFTLETKNRGADLGLTIVKKSKPNDTKANDKKPNDKKYFLKIYPYSEETYRQKLIEIEIFKLLDPENSMNVDLYVDKANDCIIFCSEQALTGKIKLFPTFDFDKIKTELKQPKTEEEQKEKKEEETETRKAVLEEEQLTALEKEQLKNNQDFKNLCQFFKIITYSVLLKLGDVRKTNVLMASEKQDDGEDIRIKLIDFQTYLIGYDNIRDYNFEEIKKFLENFLDFFFYINSEIYTLGINNRQYLQTQLNLIKDFIQKNPEISQILEEKVLEYIEEVFGKIEELSQETETKSKQLSSEPTTAVSSTTPPLSAQSSCDDTAKSPETPEQSREDSKTLLEVRVEILKQFCERYQYIQEQLRKCSQSKITETPTGEVKLLPKAEQQSLKAPKDAKSINEFVNPSSAKPTSDAATSATLKEVAVKYAYLIEKLLDRQERLEKIQKIIKNIKEIINGQHRKNQELVR